jgi:membrane protein implicated in regulation of membrane protease activity
MSGAQIAALICAIVLLLPGGCFLFFGVSMAATSDAIARGVAPLLLIVAAVILSVTALLFWVAFRRRRPAPAIGEAPQAPRDPEP